MKRIQENILPPLEKLYIIFSLFIFSGALLPLLNSKTQNDQGETGILFNTIIIFIFLILIFKLNFKTLVTYSLKNTALFLLIGLIILSCLWSDDFDLTLKRSLLLVASTIFGVYLGNKLSINRILELVHYTLLIATILSFIFILFFQEYGIMNETQNMGLHTGSWKGIFIHKNKLGKIMVLQILVNLYMFKYYNKLFYLFVILISILFIVFSKSTSALLISFLLILFYLYASLSKNFRILFLIVLTIIVIFLSMTINVSDFFGVFGKSTDLTGRIPLWIELFNQFKLKPYFGYGFEGFWSNTNRISEIWYRLNWDNIEQAHNGYLDLMLSLGISGLFLYLFVIFSNLRKYFLEFRLKNANYFWGLSFFSFLIMYNFLESTTIKHNDVFWVIFVTTIISNNKFNYSTK
jgi:O-antigen ligase